VLPKQEATLRPSLCLTGSRKYGENQPRSEQHDSEDRFSAYGAHKWCCTALLEPLNWETQDVFGSGIPVFDGVYEKTLGAMVKQCTIAMDRFNFNEVARV